MRKLLSGMLVALATMIVTLPYGARAATIGVSLSSDTNPFYIAVLRGIKARAGELGFDISVVTANSDVAKQLNGVNDLIAKGVDGILISPIDAKALCGAFDNAAKAKIPMMSIARGSACKSQIHHVSMDEVGIGRQIGEWTARKIGGKGKVAMLSGPAGAATFRNLTNGFRQAVGKFPGIKIVFQQDMLLTRENGLRYAEDALVANPDIKAIYGANDELGMGAAQAVAAAGKKGKIVVTGMNGIPPALFAVKRGDMGLTVSLQPVSWGRFGIDIMAAYLKSGDKPSKGYRQHVLVDSGNVDKFLAPFIKKKK